MYLKRNELKRVNEIYLESMVEDYIDTIYGRIHDYIKTNQVYVSYYNMIKELYQTNRIGALDWFNVNIAILNKISLNNLIIYTNEIISK